MGNRSPNCSQPGAILEDDILSPMGWGKLAFGLVPGGDAGRILAELPSLMEWDLKAFKTGGEVLCPLPGQLLQEGGPSHPSRGRHLWGGQNKGWSQQNEDFRGP